MELNIQNKPQQFIPIQAFRTTWGLADDFALATFEPENRQGLGSLDRAGPVLGQIKHAAVQAVPVSVPVANLFSTVSQLAADFQRDLQAVNVEIGLREPEIDFARAGFEDILFGAVDEFVRLHQQYRSTPDEICGRFNFDQVYWRWLNAGVRVGTSAKIYQQGDVMFEIFVVYNPYGRIGLEVHVHDQLHYVLDTSLACPAANYMTGLCQTVAETLCAAFVRNLSSPGRV